jgi:hypothetical protein
MRACLETQKLEQLEARMDEIADRVARDRTNAARERAAGNGWSGMQSNDAPHSDDRRAVRR